MARRAYSADEKAQALALYEENGPSETARLTGIPMQTIASWARRAGLHTHRVENTANATQAHLADLAQRRILLAHELLNDIERLRQELFSPCVRREVKVISTGRGLGQEVEIIDVDTDQPTFSEQARIMTAIGIAVDKAQLLSGQATERHESLDSSVDEELRRLSAELALNGPT